MTQYDQDSDGSGGAFFSGLFTGAVIGAGLALWFAPRSGAEFRGQVSDSARAVGDAVTKKVDDLTETGRGVYNQARDAAARAGAEIDRMATETGKAVEKGMDRAKGAANDAAAAAGGSGATAGTTGGTMGGATGAAAGGGPGGGQQVRRA